MGKKYFLKVYGCQMNQYDAGIIRTILDSAGYDEAQSEKEASIILLVTCSVRQHAEVRALGQINYWRRLKYQNPQLIIGVLGCMAQNFKEKLLNKTSVDIVVGPDQYHLLPKLIKDYTLTKKPRLAIEENCENYTEILPRIKENSVTGFIAIMRGCDNFCSYCIVPYVRGRERSKPLSVILKEAYALINQGVKEITLIGQNVLAWKDRNADFLTLIKEIDQLEGYYRLRFITSHPKNFTAKHWDTLGTLKKFCPYIHLPLQSGSNRILALMNRGYTKEEYLEKIAYGRMVFPDLALTTDIMVGFPTETDEDYEETLGVMQQVRFDFAYMFKYSERPNTEAQKIYPKVPSPISAERLKKLIILQNEITHEKINSYINKQCEVLIEFQNSSISKGRTKDNKMVTIQGRWPIGAVFQCRISGVSGWTLVGEVVDKQSNQPQN
jgi:tRNA-2-methylthio-N6-dimethylallyladenosine synthase